MYRGSGPRIFPLIVIILVVALVVAALVSVGRIIFSGNSTPTTTSQNKETLAAAVLNTGDSRSVRWTVRGPIVADENFRSYQITVSPTSRIYVVYSGYLDQVVSTKTLNNNKKAYEQLVYALDKAEISKTRTAKDEDFRGVCATQGVAYMFETMASDKVDQTIWSSSCKGSKGTMTANAAQVQALFVNQIPDFKPIFTEIY